MVHLFTSPEDLLKYGDGLQEAVLQQ
jgi:hypothetical protein